MNRWLPGPVQQLLDAGAGVDHGFDLGTETRPALGLACCKGGCGKGQCYEGCGYCDYEFTRFHRYYLLWGVFD